MTKVIRQPGTDSFYVADGRGQRFQPIFGPFPTEQKARRALDRARSLTLDKRKSQCSGR